MDRVFHALSDSKRRAMLKMLSQSQMQVAELGEPFGMSKQATSKHLAVLEQAGFVEKLKEGRIKRCTLNAKPLKDVEQFVRDYHKFWVNQFDALESYIEKRKRQEGDENDS